MSKKLHNVPDLRNGKEVEEHASRVTVNHHNIRHDTCPPTALHTTPNSWDFKCRPI